MSNTTNQIAHSNIKLDDNLNTAVPETINDSCLEKASSFTLKECQIKDMQLWLQKGCCFCQAELVSKRC